MEKKDNNAVEKVEKVVDKNKKSSQSQSKKKQPKKSQAKKTAKNKGAIKQEKKREREKARAERETLLAQKKLKLKELKAHKKAERQKALAMERRERERKRELLKAQREKKKEEKERKRELAKNMSKTERTKALAEERAIKLEQKREKQRQKAELKQEKFRAKRERREQKQRNKQKNKEQRRGFGGWLAAVISLGVASLILAGVLGYTLLMPNLSDMQLESAYSKSFYDTVEQVDNIDLNLSKILATNDTGAMQTYLVDLAINSELAENDIQSLPLQDENKFYTTKLVNQIGDYAKYLNKKLINGEPITEQDRQSLENLYQANLTLKDALNRAMVSMGDMDNFSFRSMEKGDDNLLVNEFNGLQNLSVEYPELIYDGPFSDGLDNREIKGLGGREINQNEARDIFASIFGGRNLGEIKNDGTIERGIPCYNITAEAEGQTIYAQISKVGGKLVMFDCAGSCNSEKYSDDYVIEKAEEFLQNLGIEGMKPVWHNLSNNVYTINFAYTQNGIIVYSDLIKVRVCAETADIIGMEASGYYTNHVEREIARPVLTKSQAAEKVSSSIELQTARLAVCPIGNSSEKLCYEFSGEKDGNLFYIYIDAITGRQVQMFKVIESTEGTLLM